jgi:cytochrome c oxidase subunit 2
MSWWDLPQSVSTFGGDVDRLYRLILVLTGVAFVLTEAVLVYFLWRYRDRPGRKASYVHGNRTAELVWTIVPGPVLFGLAVYQYSAWTRIKMDLPSPEAAVQVELAPKQFLWAVRYPGPDNQYDTADDIAGPNNDIHVPVGEPVLVRLRGQDVIHSFFLPHMRVKQDALPGSIIYAWFEATEAGSYPVACTELCGLGHYSMDATLTVESRAEFESWLAEQQAQQTAMSTSR